jgi:uncharacterized membrane protein YidH (DUF202 family)
LARLLAIAVRDQVSVVVAGTVDGERLAAEESMAAWVRPALAFLQHLPAAAEVEPDSKNSRIIQIVKQVLLSNNKQNKNM